MISIPRQESLQFLGKTLMSEVLPMIEVLNSPQPYLGAKIFQNATFDDDFISKPRSSKVEEQVQEA
jgi:hypothetical protein